MFYIYIIANLMYLVYVVFYRTKNYFKIFPYAGDYRINSNWFIHKYITAALITFITD